MQQFRNLIDRLDRIAADDHLWFTVTGTLIGAMVLVFISSFFGQ